MMTTWMKSEKRLSSSYRMTLKFCRICVVVATVHTIHMHVLMNFSKVIALVSGRYLNVHTFSRPEKNVSKESEEINKISFRIYISMHSQWCQLVIYFFNPPKTKLSIIDICISLFLHWWSSINSILFMKFTWITTSSWTLEIFFFEFWINMRWE